MSNQMGFTRTQSFGHIMHGTDFCDHVTEADLSNAIGYSWEKDSHGYVYVEIMCQCCHDEMQKEGSEEPVCCTDCNNTFPRKEVKEWKWYDFYAAQGDVPYQICNTCWNLPKHQQRVANDDANFNNEFGILNN